MGHQLLRVLLLYSWLWPTLPFHLSATSNLASPTPRCAPFLHAQPWDNISVPDFLGRGKSTAAATPEGAAAVVCRYFESWNLRDMSTAVSLFAEDCTYEDTQYSSPFTGRSALSAHLEKVAEALPPTFEFVVDDVSSGPSTSVPGSFSVGVQWHVENNGAPLPFTRGCSMYVVSPSLSITSGFDVPEPAPLKQGNFGLAILSTASKLIAEPVRVIPLSLSAVYCYVVFFSNGILPGLDATQLEARTWSEVRDLSLNFFLVAPALGLR